MSGQSEFEEWAKNNYGLKKRKNGGYRYLRTIAASEGWQACAERKDKDYQEMLLEYADYKIQAKKEIAALRAFAKDLFIDVMGCDGNSFIDEMLVKHRLIDESGNPTPLLTGESE